MPRGVYPRASLRDRFWANVDIPMVAGRKSKKQCWPWTGPTDKKGKYGQFRGHPESRQAHRIAWMLFHGVTLQPGEVIHHKCHERKDHSPLCCNPHHMEVMEEFEHRSMHAKKRWHDHHYKNKPFRDV